MEGGRKADLAAAYHKEYQAFIQKLQRFHETRGLVFQRAPTFSGRPIDLYVLYKTVTSLGGLCKVTDEGRWPEISKCFDLPSRCTNVCYALRQHYIRYLEAYEKANFLGEDNDSHDTRSFSYHGSFQGLGSNPAVTETNMSGLFGPLGEPRISNFNRLVFSLMSGLQNEAPRMVDLMLAHIGVMESDELRTLYKHWYKKSNRNFYKAWNSFIEDDDFGQGLLNSIHTGHTQSSSSVASHMFAADLRAEQHRIQQVAVILFNFSFEQINAYFLADKSTCLNFLMLSCCCQLPSIRRLALDTFDNIADSISLSIRESATTQSILLVLNKLLISSDRFQCAKAMMILSKLCTLEENIQTICEGFVDRSYAHVISMLTLPDIQLILSSLDLLYSLSSFGPDPCSAISSVHGAIDSLVTLISVHAESYGNDAIAGFKIVENKNSISAQKAQQEKAMRSATSSLSGGANSSRKATRQSQLLPSIVSQTSNSNSMTNNTQVDVSEERSKSSAVASSDTQLMPRPSMMKPSPENGRLQHTQLTTMNGLQTDSASMLTQMNLTCQQDIQTMPSSNKSETQQGTEAPRMHPVTSDPPITPLPVANGDATKEQMPPLNGQQIVAQCNTIMEQIKKEIQQHFVQFHHHRQQIEIIQLQLQQVMQQQQQQQNATQTALPANIMTEVQSKVKTHHGQMQLHYSKLQHLQLLSQQIQHKINMEEENLKKDSDLLTTGVMRDQTENGSSQQMQESSIEANGMPMPQLPSIVNGVTVTMNGTMPSVHEGFSASRTSTTGQATNTSAAINSNGLPNKRKTTDGEHEAAAPSHKLNHFSQPTHADAATWSSKEPLSINGLKNSKQVTQQSRRNTTSSKFVSRRALLKITEKQSLSDGGLRGAACIPCRWKGCHQAFSSTSDLTNHMTSYHVPEDDHSQSFCLVADCEDCAVLFHRPAMLEHLKAVHCSVYSCVRNSLDWSNRIDPANRLLPDWLISSRAEACAPEEESPVTRSVRLTAALILRNIARHSPQGKRTLLHYQNRLASVAMTTSEASPATSDCLFELSRIISDDNKTKSVTEGKNNSMPVDYT